MIKIKPKKIDGRAAANRAKAARSNAYALNALGTPPSEMFASAAFDFKMLTVNNDKSITVTKRGRPSTGKAMTNAQRQAKFKALKKAHGNG